MANLEEKISHYKNSYQGPCLFYDLVSLQTKAKFLASLGNESRVKFLFTVKSFPHKKAIAAVSSIMAGFEVSNLNEYALLPPKRKSSIISVNDPTGCIDAKFSKQMHHNDTCYINLNRLSAELLDELPLVANVFYGVRVSHTSIPVKMDTYPKGVRNSRFGSLFTDLKQYKKYFHSQKIRGIHLHNGSEKNTLDTYCSMFDELLSFLKREKIAISVLNLGGGLHKLTDTNIVELVSYIDKALHKTAITCFFEPGQTVARESGYAVAKVCSIKKIHEYRYEIISDISRECHLKWSDPVLIVNPEFGGTEAYMVEVVISGPTCFENDRIGTFRVPCPKGGFPFMSGDVMVFKNINGYSMAWNTSFNGIVASKVEFI